MAQTKEAIVNVSTDPTYIVLLKNVYFIHLGFLLLMKSREISFKITPSLYLGY